MSAPQIISLILSILTFCGFGTVIAWLWKEHLEQRKSKSEKEKARIKKQKQEEMREVMREELEPLKEQVNNIEEDLSLDKQATIATIRNEMYNLWQKCKNKNYATVTEKANWNELYEAYKNLGGNHFREYVNQWKIGMDELPIGEDR